MVANMVLNYRKLFLGAILAVSENPKKKKLENGKYMSAVVSASTSVEEVPRALIHCFGGKPEMVWDKKNR